jgi:hypothetical protein bacD2_23304
MKKMMFNDRYGLTQAVISGRKTVTRRIIDPQGKYEELRWWQPCIEFEECMYGYTENEGWEVIEPRYNVGEIVAVAQRYDSFLHPNNGVIEHDYQTTALASKGWDNKMFVKADLMPHQIQIRDIRIERLQDISDDYFKEGITFLVSADDGRIQWGYADEHLRYYMFDSPREAFASLIDKVSGKGTWDRNPFVWRIEFQLVK